MICAAGTTTAHLPIVPSADNAAAAHDSTTAVATRMSNNKTDQESGLTALNAAPPGAGSITPSTNCVETAIAHTGDWCGAVHAGS